jgi:hypothetical protein
MTFFNVVRQDYLRPVDGPFSKPSLFAEAPNLAPCRTRDWLSCRCVRNRRKTMTNKTKLILAAGLMAIGLASPALADGVPVIPQFSLPSEAPGFGNPVAPQRQTVVRNRALYNSTVAPNAGAYQSEWPEFGGGNTGR